MTGAPSKFRTVASVGDKTLPVVSGEPGASVMAERVEPVRPRRPEARISGRVVDENGDPVSGVRVRLAIGNTPGGKVVRSKTDATGAFTLRGVRPGSSYTVIAELEDGDRILSGRGTARAPDTDVRISLAEGSDVAQARASRKGVSPVSDRSELDDTTAEEPDEENAPPPRTRRRRPADENEPPAVNTEDLPPATEAEALVPRETRATAASSSSHESGTRIAGWRRGSASNVDGKLADSESETLARPSNLAPRDPETRETSTSSEPAAPSSAPEPVSGDDDGPNPLPPALEREPEEAEKGAQVDPQPAPGGEEKPKPAVAESLPPDAPLDPFPPAGEEKPSVAQAVPDQAPVEPVPPAGEEKPAVAESLAPKNPFETLPPAGEERPAVAGTQPARTPLDSLPPSDETAASKLLPAAYPGALQLASAQKDEPAPVASEHPESVASSAHDQSIFEEAPAEPAAPQSTPAPVQPAAPPAALAASSDQSVFDSAPGDDPASPPAQAEKVAESKPAASEPVLPPDDTPAPAAPAVAAAAPVDPAVVAAAPSSEKPDDSRKRPTWKDLAPRARELGGPIAPKTAALASTSAPLPSREGLPPREEPSPPGPSTRPPDDGKAFCDYDTKHRMIRDFRLPDLQGRPVRFKELDADLILLDFWGTWCQPCLRSVPHLVDLQKRLDKSKVLVVGIACEQAPPAERPAAVARQAQRLKINYPILLSGMDGACPLQQALHIQAYPTLVLVDRQGHVVWRDQGSTAMTLARLDRFIASATKAGDTARY
jgi:thiol-disulfide isomerase/thioredoxin